MELDFTTVRGALGAQCGAISRALLDLPADGFVRPTRLPPWDVLHLAAHLYRDMERVPLALEQPEPSVAPDTDVVTYWHYDRTENAVRTQARADRIAASYKSGAALARAFHALQQQAVARLGDTRPDLVVRTWAPTMRVDHFAATRVVEVAVHGLDLAQALGRPIEMDGDAVALTSEVLVGLLAAPVPRDLGWDRTTWIETGCGRRSLAPHERRLLGPLADRFPLLA